MNNQDRRETLRRPHAVIRPKHNEEKKLVPSGRAGESNTPALTVLGD